MNKKLATLFYAIAEILEVESSHTVVVGPFNLPKELGDAIKDASGAKEPDAPTLEPSAPAQEISTPTAGAPEQAWEELDHDDFDNEIESNWEWRLKEGYQHSRVDGVRPERAWRSVEDRHIDKFPGDFSKAEFRRPV